MEKTNNPEVNQPGLQDETLLFRKIRESIQTFYENIQQELTPEDSQKIDELIKDAILQEKMRAKDGQSEVAQKSIEQYVSDIYAKFLTSSLNPAKHDNDSLSLAKRTIAVNKESASQEEYLLQLEWILYALEKTYGYPIEKEGEDDEKILAQLLQKVIQEEKDGKIKIGSYGAETIMRFIAYKLNISDFDAKTLFDLFYEKSQKPLQKGEKKLSLFDLFDYISRQNEKRFSVLGYDGSKNTRTTT